MKYINAKVAYRKYSIPRGILHTLHQQGVVGREEREAGRYTMFVYNEQDIVNFINGNERK